MKFIIIATQRSGTILLTTFLNSHPDLNVYAEESLKFANNLPHNYGANLKYNQLNIKVDLSRFKVIQLIWKNLRNLAISRIINKNKKKFKRPAHIYPSSKLEDAQILISDTNRRRDEFINRLPESIESRVSKEPILIDVEALDREMMHVSQEVVLWNNKLKDQALTIYYEDMCSDQEISEMPIEVSNKICNFLNIKTSRLTSKLKKVNSSNYEEFIVNYKEIRNINDELCSTYLSAISK